MTAVHWTTTAVCPRHVVNGLGEIVRVHVSRGIALQPAAAEGIEVPEAHVIQACDRFVAIAGEASGVAQETAGASASVESRDARATATSDPARRQPSQTASTGQT
jgi:hypothetical protein